ncbi:protoheme IX farnesyltransferase, mitochondrial [Bradysia coprophila]|uniref:protoheme IX farnesyltransferase, mitochondrial n=1 Tax=Bradysia coprophila TaxID=38358 RepID=UPI00187DBA07|nr:protoheme IX farnesyltransferase, mitochondrial [Bradysia coprophila]
MYCVSFQSKQLLTYGKRLVRSHGDYIKRTFHDRIVLQQSHKLSQKQIEQINLKEEENPNSKAERIAIVVPVPTTNPLISSIVGNPLVTGDAFKNVSKESKKSKVEEWTVTPSEDLSKLGKHYLMLSKSRLTSLVVITSMAGYAMAPAPFELSTFILCSVGTGLCSAAANSINQYHEVPFDAQMSRTKNRVLVKGILTPLHAIGFAIGAASTGICMLYYGVNGLTAALGAANLILYTSIYTPMKRFSILNTWVGSIVGAIPPVMGWVGCSGTIDAGAWILAGLLYAWQFPHFNALSWNLRPDYSRAGYRMMAVTNPALCRRTALRYTVALGVLSCAAPIFDVTNLWFAFETLPLNAYFAYLAWRFYKNSDSGTSRKLFRFSLLHLPALMILFLLNKKRWIFTEEASVATMTENAGIMVAANESIEMTPPVMAETTTNELGELGGTIAKLEEQAVEALKNLLSY